MMDTVKLKKSGRNIVFRISGWALSLLSFHQSRSSKGRKKNWKVECNSSEICDELKNLNIETESLNIDIIGISWLKWPVKGDYKIILNGDDRVTRVDFVMNR